MAAAVERNLIHVHEQEESIKIVSRLVQLALSSWWGIKRKFEVGAVACNVPKFVFVWVLLWAGCFFFSPFMVSVFFFASNSSLIYVCAVARTRFSTVARTPRITLLLAWCSG